MTKFQVLYFVLQNSKDGRSSFSGAGWGGAGGNVDGRKGKEMGDDNNRRFGAASVWAQRSQVYKSLDRCENYCSPTHTGHTEKTEHC